MTGGGVRSMLRRAKAGFRKLTKRNKPQSRKEEFKMVSRGPTVATTKFGPNTGLPRILPGHMEAMENEIKKNKENARQLILERETLQTIHKKLLAETENLSAINKELTRAKEKCISEKFECYTFKNQAESDRNKITHMYTTLEKEHKATLKDLESAEADLKNLEKKYKFKLNDFKSAEDELTKLETKHNETVKELESAVAKLAECEAGKESGSRRRKAATKMYRQAHIDRTLGALNTESALLNTESALDKTIEVENALVKAEDKYKGLKAKYDREVQHTDTKSKKVAELEKQVKKLKMAQDRIYDLELEAEVHNAQIQAAANRMANNKVAFQKTLNNKNAELGQARNQIHYIQDASKLKAKAAALNNTYNIFKKRQANSKTQHTEHKSNQPLVGLRFTSSG